MTSQNLPQSGTRKNNRDGGRKNTAALDAAAAEVRAEMAAEEAAAESAAAARARQIGATMAALDALLSPEAYMAVTREVVDAAEKNERGIFTDRGMDDVLLGFRAALAVAEAR
jgi:hypothetical protein